MLLSEMMALQRTFNLHIYILFLCLELVFCFNLDISSPIVHSGPENSYFGFSLSGYRSSSSNWLIIGAPKAQTNQSDVTEGGSVFMCSPSQSNKCSLLLLDVDQDGNELGNTYKTNPRSDSEEYQFDEKSHQMFGATIESSRIKGGPLLVCAPRYTWHNILFVNQYIIGRCFAVIDLQEIKSYTPCYTEEKSNQRQGGTIYGQAGISAAIPKDAPVGDTGEFVLGAVGTGHWQGSAVKLNFATDSVQFSYMDVDNANLDHNYKGYALDYITMSGELLHVIGAPRAEKLFGVVYLISNTINALLSLKEFKGEQFASYFGQSLAVLDLNGDGYEDLVVGAPLYANKNKWECGRIYIYYQDPRIEFKDPVKITGQRIRSRLGYSLAALGDINADGFRDLGVGAPFDGEDGSGVVYIYQGRMDGIKMEPSQIITTADVNANVTSFGAALSGGIDVDDNAYPDVLIGAYQSSKAFLLRSRPVINVIASIQAEPKGINLDEKNLQLSDGTMVTSYTVKACLRYNGTSVPASQKFQVTINLDQSQLSQSRTVFQHNSNSSSTYVIPLNADGVDDCITEVAYIQENIGDKLNPIVMSMTIALVEQAGIPLPPILNQHSRLASSQVYFLNSCKNNVCIPDLSIDAKTLTDTVTIGDEKGLAINVTVENKGDMSFSSMLKSDLPNGVGFKGIRRSDITDIFIDCDYEEHRLECDIGNPLPAKKKINMLLYLSVDDLEGASDMLSFVLRVDSLNQENQTTLDNNVDINVRVKVSARIELKGISIPEQVTFYEERAVKESGITSEQDIGPEVHHVYEVLNHGPSSVGITEVKITWPMRTVTGDYLFYLIDVTTNIGDVCIVSGGVDPMNFTMIQEQPTYKVVNRLTRDVSVYSPKPSVQPLVSELSSCTGGSDCVNITCHANMIDGRQSFIITLRSRLYVDTLIKNNIKETSATSFAFSRVLSMPYLIAPDVERQDSLEITTDVNPATPTTEAGKVEIWIIIVSIICGLLLLLLVAAILYKVGFFKRKTIPTDETNGISEADDDFD